MAISTLSLSLLQASTLLGLPCLIVAADGWKEKRNEDGNVVQQMKIEAPTMTEEDQYGYNMPDKYRCDSCKAVVFHLTQTLQRRQPKSRRMHEWEYNELFEETCQDAFEGYGIKLVDGQNALSGPGLKQPDNLAPGGAMIQMGGDSWKKRLAEICRKLVYDKVGEDELYDTFHRKGEIPELMCWEEMGQCSAIVKPQKSKKKTAKPEKKMPETKSNSNSPGNKSMKTQPNLGQAKDIANEQVKVQVNTDGNVAAFSRSVSSLDVNQSNAGDQMSFGAFIKSMAQHDDLAADDFSRSRSQQEWERLIVAMAGKIYSKQA